MTRLRDPLATARGLGSAKDGTGHWWALRLSSVALLLLTPWFVSLLLGVGMGAERHQVAEVLARPLNASLMVAWLLSVFWHAQLGLQVVIEDYVHGWQEITLQVANRLLCALGAIASVLAVGRIYFAA